MSPTEAEIEAVASVVRNAWLTDAEGIARMQDEARNIALDCLTRLHALAARAPEQLLDEAREELRTEAIEVEARLLYERKHAARMAPRWDAATEESRQMHRDQVVSYVTRLADRFLAAASPWKPIPEQGTDTPSTTRL